MFIGRTQELKKLNRMYQSGKLEVAIIYGRRRVGKTAVINEFCKNKRTVFLRLRKAASGKIWKYFLMQFQRRYPVKVQPA